MWSTSASLLLEKFIKICCSPLTTCPELIPSNKWFLKISYYPTQLNEHCNNKSCKCGIVLWVPHYTYFTLHIACTSNRNHHIFTKKARKSPVSGLQKTFLMKYFQNCQGKGKPGTKPSIHPWNWNVGWNAKSSHSSNMWKLPFMKYGHSWVVPALLHATSFINKHLQPMYTNYCISCFTTCTSLLTVWLLYVH